MLDQLAWTSDRCLVIGEVAQSHEGSLGMAHAFIDAIAAAGADAVKFQTHIAAAESTPAEPWRTRFSTQDSSRYDYWKRMEFSEEQWRELRDHAAAAGLLFLSSPFSMEALELLERVGVSAWKVASGELTNGPMLERMAGGALPVLLSTGMSSFEEIDTAVEVVRSGGAPLTVLQCTSGYPVAPEEIGLNAMLAFRDRYRCPVGLSDHSGTVFPALAAVTLGARVIEVHVTLSREMFGPDVPASVTTSELATITTGVRYIERMMASEVDKNAMASRLEGMRALFTKSIVAGSDLPTGTILRSEHLKLKKPGTGLPAERLSELVGRRLTRSVRADDMINFDVVEVSE